MKKSPLIIYFLLISLYYSIPVYGKLLISNAPNPIEYFIGRNELLAQLEDRVNNKHIIQLTGLAGIGKTQIMRKYISLKKDQFDIIWVIDCYSDTHTQIQLLKDQINDKLKAKKYFLTFFTDDIITELVKFIAEHNLKILLVIENGENISDVSFIEKLKIISNQQVKILISSRKPLDNIDYLKVGPFTFQESEKLTTISLLNRSSEDVQTLLDLFAGYPIALNKAISFLNENPNVTIAGYIKLFEKYSITLLEKNVNFSTKSEISLQQSIKLTMNKIKMDNNDSFYLAIICGYFTDSYISSEILKEVYFKTYNTSEELNYIDALNPLIKYSILEVQNKDDNSQNNIKDFAAHSLIQKLMLEEVGDVAQHSQNIKYILQAYLQYIPEDYASLYKYLEEHHYTIPNIEKILYLADKYHVHDFRVAILQIRLLRMYIVTSIYNKVELLLSQIEKNIVKYSKRAISNEFSTAISNYYISKSYIYDYKYTDHRASLNALEQALKYLKDHNKDYQTYYSLLCNLVETLVDSGDLKNAKHNFRKIAEIIKKKNISSNRGFYYYLKAKILKEEGLIKEAIVSINQAINIDQNEFNKFEKYNVFTIYDYLILTELMITEDNRTEAFKILAPLFVAFNTTLNHSAEVDHKMKMLIAQLSDLFAVNGVDYIEETINMIKIKNNAAQNIELANAYMVKAELLDNQGYKKEALLSYINAFEVHKARYGEKFQLYSTSNLINKIVKQAIKTGDTYIAKKFYLIHKQSFGFNSVNKEMYMLLTKS